MTSKPWSAMPGIYYAIFRYYEPLLGIGGLLAVLADPKTAHDNQSPWPDGVNPSATDLPLGTRIMFLQLAAWAWLMTTLNYVVLGAARRHLGNDAALHRRVVSAYMATLLFGDFMHIALSLWAFGEVRWRFWEWTVVMRATIGLGLTLLIPRVMWYLGVGC